MRTAHPRRPSLAPPAHPGDNANAPRRAPAGPFKGVGTMADHVGHAGPGEGPPEPAGPPVKQPVSPRNLSEVPFPRGSISALLAAAALGVVGAVAGQRLAAGAAVLAAALALATFLRWVGLRAKGEEGRVWQALDRLRAYLVNEPASGDFCQAGAADAVAGKVARSTPRP